MVEEQCRDFTDHFEEEKKYDFYELCNSDSQKSVCRGKMNDQREILM